MEKDIRIEIEKGVVLYIGTDKITELVRKEYFGQKKQLEPVVVEKNVSKDKYVTKHKKVSKPKFRKRKTQLTQQDVLKIMTKIGQGTANQIRTAMKLGKQYEDRVRAHIWTLREKGIVKGDNNKPKTYKLVKITQDKFNDEKFRAWWEKITGEDKSLKQSH